MASLANSFLSKEFQVFGAAAAAVWSTPQTCPPSHSFQVAQVALFSLFGDNLCLHCTPPDDRQPEPPPSSFQIKRTT